jgi:hypothetical protein
MEKRIFKKMMTPKEAAEMYGFNQGPLPITEARKAGAEILSSQKESFIHGGGFEPLDYEQPGHDSGFFTRKLNGDHYGSRTQEKSWPKASKLNLRGAIRNVLIAPAGNQQKFFFRIRALILEGSFNDLRLKSFKVGQRSKTIVQQEVDEWLAHVVKVKAKYND